MAIPSGNVVDLLTMCHMLTQCYILEYLVDGVPHVQLSIGIGRSIVQHECGLLLLLFLVLICSRDLMLAVQEGNTLNLSLSGKGGATLTSRISLSCSSRFVAVRRLGNFVLGRLIVSVYLCASFFAVFTEYKRAPRGRRKTRNIL